MDKIEKALENYQSAYDDGQFRRLQMTIVADVCGLMQLMSQRSIELGKNATADMLNLVIRCAEQLCGFDYVEDPFVELRAAMFKVKKPELVEAICEYLRPYPQGDHEALEKFRHTTLTALLLGKVESQLDALSELAQERQLCIPALETSDDLIAAIRHLINITRHLLLEA